MPLLRQTQFCAAALACKSASDWLIVLMKVSPHSVDDQLCSRGGGVPAKNVEKKSSVSLASELKLSSGSSGGHGCEIGQGRTGIPNGFYSAKQ